MLWCLNIAILLTVNQPFVSGKRILSYAGSYKATAEKWHGCPENKPTDKIIFQMHPFHPSHPKALQRINGNVSLRAHLDDTLMALIRLDLWNNNQWKENAFIFNFPNKACSVLRSNIPEFFRAILPPDLYSRQLCSIPPGKYSLINEPVNWTFPNVPILPYGTYRFVLNLALKKEAFGCTIVECKITPQV